MAFAEFGPSPPVVMAPPARLVPRPVWDWFPGPTWLVAMVGLVVAGLLARLLLGALSLQGGGVGVGGLVVLGAVVVLVVRRVLHRCAKPPSVTAAAGAPPPRKELPPAPPRDLDRGLQAIRRADLRFEPAAFAGYAAMTFRDVERARFAGDADSLRGRVTPEMYAELRAFCEESRTAGRSVRIDELDVGAEVTEAWQDGDQDYVTACVAGTTHTVADATGPVVSGSRPTATAVKAFLTFTRPAGLNSWTLSIIQEPRP